ncbi:hypothetical protein B296_00005173 [Ensete ventricosum]|uniref:DUF4704 domain-containing protein n=1 Tax=Ensete ventricosum TaxID=4639 RepID=A0A427AZN3_ENSVE|nr:hypothetical protein B296_00005173 [Ensete ventricosum]
MHSSSYLWLCLCDGLRGLLSLVFIQVEGSIVHIMKALASQPSAAQSLIEDDSLQLLFHMVANGSSNVFSQFRDGLVPLHTIQLHRHAMQVFFLSFMIGIRKSIKIIRVLLMAVKDFSPEKGDAAYTMGIVDLLLECVELSHRPGPAESAGGKASRSTQNKGTSYRSLTAFDRLNDEEKGNAKVKDLEAIQTLQDIFLKADNVELQAEVLNRMFKIFSCHLDNYMLCQQLRTLPLFILNMAGFPDSLQEIVLKILEYAVTVVNCIPEQELLSLCCLLQQPITASLKHTILAFFVKLLSFDQKFKKVLREVGVLEVLLDDLKQHKYFSGVEQQNRIYSGLDTKSSSVSFKKHMDNKDAILSSPNLVGSGSGKFPVFEDESTIAIAWDCLFSLLRRAEANQQSFRSSNGVSIILPFLISDCHRSGVLRLLSCLIIEDALQNIELPDIQSSMNIFCFLMRAITAGVSNNALNRLRLHAIMSSQTFYDLLCESGLLCVECEKHVIQLLFELALEIVLPPSAVHQEEKPSLDMSEDEPNSFLTVSLGISRFDGERIYNASAVGVLIRSLLLFTPKVQLDILKFIEKLARAGPFNQENLTSVGQLLVDMMEKLVQMEDIRSDSVSLAPYVEMDMSKVGHSSIQVSLGERTWPPAAGYSFVCWFQYHNLLKSQVKESEQASRTGSGKRNVSSGQMLRIFSVGAINDGNTLYAEICLQDNGVLTLATSNSCSLAFPGIEMEEGRWHHLAVVHSKPNALAGLFQASVAYLYVNGKLIHTGKLGYSLSPVGKSLQVTLGTPVSRAKVSDLSWRLRCCYLFEEVLTSGSIFFMYILGRGYRGLFQDTDLLRFVPNQACGGDSMAILDSLEAESPMASNSQRLDSSGKLGEIKSDCSGIVWDLERLTNLSLQLSGKKLIFAFDGTSSEAFRTSGTLSLLNLVDPTSAAASPIGGMEATVDKPFMFSCNVISKLYFFDLQVYHAMVAFLEIFTSAITS